MLAFIDPESRIPANHPLRTIKQVADAALAELSPQFDALYAADGQGRPSIPPERLLKASLLMSLFSVRSERAFCEALDYDLRFRWFLDMDLVEPSFDHSTFTRNRERLLRAHVSRQFFDEVVVQADRLHLLSDEHFTVDGTLIEAAASLKSFRAKDEPPAEGGGASGDNPANRWVDFRGEKRSNATHQSRTDPCSVVQERCGPGCQTVLRRACRDGEPAWSARRLPGHAGEWHGGMCGGARLDGRVEGTPIPSRDGWAGQGVRHAGSGRQAARQKDHAARRPEHGWSAERH
jgi:transposase